MSLKPYVVDTFVWGLVWQGFRLCKKTTFAFDLWWNSLSSYLACPIESFGKTTYALASQDGKLQKATIFSLCKTASPSTK